jgi:antitoxin MazE
VRVDLSREAKERKGKLWESTETEFRQEEHEGDEGRQENFLDTINKIKRIGSREAQKAFDSQSQCNYSNNIMTEIKVSRIGNSRGIRLPASLLKRYQIEDAVLIEEGADSITLRPKHSKKLSWKNTASEMAEEVESWKDFETTVDDGLDHL